MLRKRARRITLLKLSPLYLIAAIILYVLVVMDKDFNYLDAGRSSFAAQDFTDALDQLDIAIDEKKYRGQELLDALMLRARTLNIMQGYSRAVRDLEKIVQLSPKSEIAHEARTLMGDILLRQVEFQKAIDTYEFLATEVEEEDEARCYEYHSKAAAAAYQYSNYLMADAVQIIRRNLKESEPIEDGLRQYMLDFHTDYDLPYVESLISDSLSTELQEEVIDLIMEAKRYHRYAYDIFKEYPFKSFFNPLAALFLTNIHHQTNRYFPALFESSMAMKEAIPPAQQVELLEIRADIYEELKAYPNAADTYATLRKSNNNLRVLRKLYFCHLQAGNYDKVVSEITPLLKNTKNDFVLRYYQAVAYLKTSRRARAISMLSRLVDEVFTGVAPITILRREERRECFVALHDAYREMNNYNKMLDTLNKAIQIYPDDQDFRTMRTNLFFEHFKNPGGAVHDCYFLMEHGPRNAKQYDRWFTGMDLAYQLSNDMSLTEKAQKEINRFLQLEGMIGNDPKRYSELMDAATFPATLHNLPLRVALYKQLLRMGRKEQGKGVLRMIVRSHPQILEFSYRLGVMYLQEGNYESALAEFKKILERDPPDIESVKKALDCCEEMKDYTGKGRIVRSLLESDHNHLKSWVLTRLSFDEEKLDNCIRMYRSITDATPDVQEDLDLMAAWCLVSAREFVEAADLIDPMLMENPRHLEAMKAKLKLLLAHPGPIVRDKPAEDEAGNPSEKANLEKGADPESDADNEIVEEVLDEPAAELPPELQKAGHLVLILSQMHKELTRRDLEDLTQILLEYDRSDLVPTLLESNSFPFPFSPEIYHSMARAYQELGEYEKAVDVLVTHGTTEDDMRWAFGLCAYSDQAIPQSRNILKKYGEINEMMTHAEPLLRAAMCTSLKTGVSESDNHLAGSKVFTHAGSYSQHDAEYIDFLAVTLNGFARSGLDISIEEIPEEPVENNGDETDEIEGDQDYVEPDDEPPVEETEAETEFQLPEGVKQRDPGQRFGRGRFNPDNENKPSRKRKKKREDAPPPPIDFSEELQLTADRIVINGAPLKNRYKKIVGEAVHMSNLWRAPVEPQDIVMVKSLLRHMLLRSVPAMEKECLAEAEKAVSLDPLCGMALRYLLDNRTGEQSADKTLAALTPVNNAIPTDFESLRRITIAFGQLKIDSLLLPCLTALQDLCPTRQEAQLVEAEIRLAIDDQAGAKQVLEEVLSSENVDVSVLKRMLPMLARMGAVIELTDVVGSLVEAVALDEASIDLILSHLEYTTLTVRHQYFLEKLLLLSSVHQRAQIIALLATIYAQKNEVLRLELIAMELSQLPNTAGQNDEIVFRAFTNTGTALKRIGLYVEALDLFETLYYLRPERADTLTQLADISMEIGKVRKATEYLNLNYFLRPWDNKNNIVLAHNWFYETGEYKKAFNLVRKTRGLSKYDPAKAAGILMGYTFLAGDAPQAIGYAVQFYPNKKAQTEDIMFISASLYYIFDQYKEARQLFSRLELTFEENKHSDRIKYLKDRIVELAKTRPAKRKAR